MNILIINIDNVITYILSREYMSSIKPKTPQNFDK